MVVVGTLDSEVALPFLVLLGMGGEFVVLVGVLVDVSVGPSM